jgi:Fe2+ or Zn2+ uptake regulation protein
MSPTRTVHTEGREEAAEALRRSGYRVTAQRLVVAEALSGAGRHLSAEQVMAAVGPAAHHHLVCRRCGAVTDLEADVALEPALAGATKRGFAPEGAEVVVRGLCESCRATA